MMNVNFFSTCIGDAVKANAARSSVLLLEELGCRVHYPRSQTCCGQPALNSGYIKEAMAGSLSKKTITPSSRLLVPARTPL